MILQALAQYYDRLLNDPSVNISPLGFEQKAIDFLIVLTQEGEFDGLRDLREGTGKNKKGRLTRVPKGVKRASGVAANLLWDTSPYVLGHLLKKDKKAKLIYQGKGAAKKLILSKSKAEIRKMRNRLPQQHTVFLEKIEGNFHATEDMGIQAVIRFLKQGDFTKVYAHPLWP
jgi:CRISPR-associated protein Csd1